MTGDGTIRELNLAGAALLGLQRSRLIGRRFGLFVSAETRPAFNAFLGRALAASSEESCEIALDREGKPPCHLHLKGVGVDSGAGWRCRLLAMDITERRRDEVALQAALEEKEVLLCEVHHRVKNNLAVIIDLLELQRESVSDALASSWLTELGYRIKSMALVHEMLYRSGQSLSRIDFRGYLQALIAYLRDSIDPSGTVRFKVTAPEIWMNLDTAIPCGLIVNELVTNAFKHAFPESRPRPGADACEIAIEMSEDGAAYALAIADNGVGLPAGLDWTSTRTLGLRLVRMLGRHQLRGQVEIDGAGGTRFSLRFGIRR